MRSGALHPRPTRLRCVAWVLATLCACCLLDRSGRPPIAWLRVHVVPGEAAIPPLHSRARHLLAREGDLFADGEPTAPGSIPDGGDNSAREGLPPDLFPDGEPTAPGSTPDGGDNSASATRDLPAGLYHAEYVFADDGSNAFQYYAGPSGCGRNDSSCRPYASDECLAWCTDTAGCVAMQWEAADIDCGRPQKEGVDFSACTDTTFGGHCAPRCTGESLGIGLGALCTSAGQWMYKGFCEGGWNTRNTFARRRMRVQAEEVRYFVEQDLANTGGNVGVNRDSPCCAGPDCPATFHYIGPAAYPFRHRRCATRVSDIAAFQCAADCQPMSGGGVLGWKGNGVVIVPSNCYEYRDCVPVPAAVTPGPIASPGPGASPVASPRPSAAPGPAPGPIVSPGPVSPVPAPRPSAAPGPVPSPNSSACHCSAVLYGDLNWGARNMPLTLVPKV